MILAKVLLISDDGDSVWLWARFLAQKGLDVTTISSEQATEENILEGVAYDLIVIDESATALSSTALIRKFRLGTSIPILLLINEPNEVKALAAYEAGADDCVIKPISPRLFVAKINAWLARSSSSPSQTQANFQVGDL